MALRDGEVLRGPGQAGEAKRGIRWRLILVWLLRLLSVAWIGKGLMHWATILGLGLVFEPAPKDERKGDPDGASSHFVAKAPWMTADDVLTVSAEIELDGKPRKPTWRTFIVKNYTHHAE